MSEIVVDVEVCGEVPAAPRKVGVPRKAGNPAAATFFTVIGGLKAYIEDTGDAGGDPDKISVTANVTFAPKVEKGDVFRASQATDPELIVPYTMTGVVGSDGIMKISATAWAPYDYTPVRLIANTDYLQLDGPLYYTVTFSNVVVNGVPGQINSFDFEAPNSDTTLNLSTLAKATGVTATGITRLAPTGVRVDGSNIVFTFDGVDVDDPIPTSVFQGATGDTGATGAT